MKHIPNVGWLFIGLFTGFLLADVVFSLTDAMWWPVVTW